MYYWIDEQKVDSIAMQICLLENQPPQIYLVSLIRRAIVFTLIPKVNRFSYVQMKIRKKRCKRDRQQLASEKKKRQRGANGKAGKAREKRSYCFTNVGPFYAHCSTEWVPRGCGSLQDAIFDDTKGFRNDKKGLAKKRSGALDIEMIVPI